MSRNLFITTTDGEGGKKVITLGIMELLIRYTGKVAYYRPIVGVRKNKSLHDHFNLIKDYFKIDLTDEQMCGYTFDEAEKLVSSGRYDEFIGGIVSKYKALEETHDFILMEGSDFAQETSSFEMDINVRVASAIGCPVLLVTQAKNREMYNVLQSIRVANETFRAEHVNIMGTIVNRVNEERVENYSKILHEQPDLKNQYLAVLPERKILSTPSLGEIVKSLDATVLCGEEQLNRQVNHFTIGTMNLENFLWGLAPGTLIITTGDRFDIILGANIIHQSKNLPDVAGILLTVEKEMDNIMLDLIRGLKNPLPILVVPKTIYETTNHMDEIHVDILPENTHKITTALSLFDSRIDGEALVQRISEAKTDKMTPKMFEYTLIQKAKSRKMHIVLPEGEDDRILRAAEALNSRGVVRLTILGLDDKVQTRIQELGLNLDGVQIIDPRENRYFEGYAQILYEQRKHKGIGLEDARTSLKDVNYFGTMMVYTGDADGMVSGAAHSTAETIRPGFQIIKTKTGVPIVSSVFLMCLEDRVLVYGDCAVNPDPNSEELAHIAIQSAETGMRFNIEPRVAMLSYSTGSSGSGSDVEKVREATRIAQELRPDLLIDGPIQYDAAVSKKVASQKMPDSRVAGQATVFIFPDLNTGNNTYKAVQRETGAIAIGPILQGLKKPVNDLSRGCTVPDIINTVTITAIQSQHQEETK